MRVCDKLRWGPGGIQLLQQNRPGFKGPRAGSTRQYNVGQAKRTENPGQPIQGSRGPTASECSTPVLHMSTHTQSVICL